ncbi:MAG TPA: recombinase family protein [Acidimicrobiales bacterium]|nr:recombinase family protein [Acidimicrobiales bacterium]
MDLIVYLRVSSESQVDGFGLEVQERACRKWAKANGHKIVGTFQDAGISGSKDLAERPGLSAAIDMLRPPPRATGLIVAKLDRLARALHVQESVLQVVWRAGASVFTADAGEVLQDDPDDPMRTFVRQVIGGVAQLERSLIAKRMRDGRNAKRDAGRHSVGQYRYGQHGAGKGRERDAAENPDEKVAVDRIMELRQAGQSYRTIAETLDSEGLRPRRAEHWSAMAVRNIAVREGTE